VLGAVAAWAPLAYEGPAQGVVRALKFRGAVRSAMAMAAPIVARAPPGWLGPDAELVPVPLHPSRARKRGYNQARLLAEAVAERTGMRVSDCLERRGAKGTQVGRGRAERLAGIAGGICLTGEPPRNPILVDDVITTGATLDACARALPPEIKAIAYARTPGR
jgi:predicted amidophosphoribosyltransferase